MKVQRIFSEGIKDNFLKFDNLMNPLFECSGTTGKNFGKHYSKCEKPIYQKTLLHKDCEKNKSESLQLEELK